MADLTEEELKKFGRKKTFLEKFAELEPSLRSTDDESSEDESERRWGYPKIGPVFFDRFPTRGFKAFCSDLLEELSEVSGRIEKEDTPSSNDESIDSREGSLDRVRIRDPKGKQMMERKWRKILSSIVGPERAESLTGLRESDSEGEDEDTSSWESDLDEDVDSVNVEGWDRARKRNDSALEKEYDQTTENRSRVYWTHSRYEGQWHKDLDVPHGKGMYVMPHGVIYVGGIYDGCFHGKGVLRYPNGAMIDGVWNHGRNIKRRITFHDGLRYKETDWDYCSASDRRFHIERLYGLRPAGRSHLTQEYPTRRIPGGCYDTGDGYYNHRTRCVYSADTKKVLRIPTDKDSEWIMKNCRKAWDENVNYEPDIFESIHDADDVESLISPRNTHVESKQTGAEEAEHSSSDEETAAKEDSPVEGTSETEIISALDESDTRGEKLKLMKRKKAPKYEIPFSIFSETFRGSDEEKVECENHDKEYIDKITESFERGKKRLEEQQNDAKLTNGAGLDDSQVADSFMRI